MDECRFGIQRYREDIPLRFSLGRFQHEALFVSEFNRTAKHPYVPAEIGASSWSRMRDLVASGYCLQVILPALVDAVVDDGRNGYDSPERDEGRNETKRSRTARTSFSTLQSVGTYIA